MNMKPIVSSRLHLTPLLAWLTAACWLVLPGAVQGTVVGQWDFSSGLNASTGISLEYFDGAGGATDANTQFGTTATFGISNAAAQVVNVMRAPKNSSAMGYVMNPNATGNGGGSLLNQYSLVMDVYFPEASSDKARCLIQIDEPWVNSNEGEFYVGANNGIGTPLKTEGNVTANAWHRLVITADLAASPQSVVKYIDGAKVGQETVNDVIDGRWALGTSRALLFTDNAGASEVVYVNSIQVHDTVLSPGYVAALGTSAEDAIPASVVPIAIVDNVRPVPGDAFVLPSTPIQADIISADQPVASSSVGLWLDGFSVTPALTYPSTGVIRATFNPGLLAPESPHTARLTCVDPARGTNVQQVEWSFRMAPYHLLPPDPTNEGLLYFGFEEPSAVDGTIVADRSPSKNHGVLHLQPGVSDLKVSGAVSNGIDFSINQTVVQNYIELTNGFTAIPNSFAAWVKVDSNYPAETRVGVILGNYPVANGINWEVHTSGRPRVYWAANLLNWIVNDDLRTGQWEHMAFVRDPVQNLFNFYRNGRLTAVLTNAGPSLLPAEAPYVASDRRASGFQPFRGALDELTVFGRSLSSNEVFRLYTATTSFPKFLFAAPPITRLRPAASSTDVPVMTPLQVTVDESFSSNTVNFGSVQLSINGVSLVPQVTRTNQMVSISGIPSPPLLPSTTNVARVRYLDNASSPHETIREWSYVTGPLSAVPVILWSSAGATVAAGDSITFAVRASGMPPITYQWRTNGIAIPGETNAALSLAALTVGQSAAYDVVLTGPGGSSTSPVAQLTVLSTLPLAGLLNDVTGYYPFEAQVDGYVSNAVRTAGYPGFPKDEAYLNGAEGDPSAMLPPWTTNLARVRAGVGALDCDGAGDYGDIVGNPVLVDQDWSVSVWFKPDTGGAGYLGTARAFVLETGGATYPISFGLRAGTTGNSNFQLYTDYVTGTNPYRDYQVPNANVDQWHHLVIRRTGNVIEGYLDGALTHTINLTGALDAYTGMRIGTYRSANSRWFKGQMDEVAFWQRALSVAEITDLRQAGQAGLTLAARIGQAGGEGFQTSLIGYYGFDAHTGWGVANSAPGVGGAGFDSDALTMMGGAIDPLARIYPITHNPALARAGWGALSADGTNDYAHITGNPVDPNQNWSVAAWFKPDTGGLGLTDTTRAFVFETSGATYPISFGLRAGPDSSTTDFQLFTQTGTGSVSQDYLLPASQVDQWHHIVLTYDAAAGALTGYLDDVRTHGIELGPGAILQSYVGFNLGTYRTADGRWFKGLIDEVAFWQRKLSRAEVRQLYTLGSAGASVLTGVPEIRVFAANTVPADSFMLLWSAAPGLKYDVEASHDLSDWSDTVVTNHTAAADTVSMIISPTSPPPANGYYDSGLSNASQRFYRVRWHP